MKWNLKKYFNKLKTRMVLTAILGLIIFSASYYFYSIKAQRALFEQSFDKQTDSLLKAVKLGIEVGLSEENYSTINLVFNWAKNDNDFVFIVLTDETEDIFASFPENYNISVENLKLKSTQYNLEDSVIVKSISWKANIGSGKIFIGFSTHTIIDFETKTKYEVSALNFIFILISTLVVLLVTSSITKPLDKLRKISSEIKNGNLEARMDETRGGNELTSVAVSFNQMVKQLISTQKVLEADIAEAVNFVNSLLPEPLNTPVKIDWYFQPSDRLGGDSFGYHFLSEDKLAIYLIDVSGHGVGAALYSVSVFNLIREESLTDTDFSNPAVLLASLNKIFQLEKYSDKYFTIWYGVLDIKTNKMVYSSAGHLPALLYNGEEINQFDSGSIFIGAFLETEYLNKEIQLNENDSFYIFSDGLIELRKKDDSILTFEEYIDILKDFSASKKELPELIEKMKSVSINNKFDDDVSIIKIQINSTPKKPSI